MGLYDNYAVPRFIHWACSAKLRTEQRYLPGTPDFAGCNDWGIAPRV